MVWLLYSFVISGFACALILSTKRMHFRASSDHQLHLPQKIHTLAVPRVGGLAIFLTLMLLQGYIWFFGSALSSQHIGQVLLLIACAVPVFSLGLAEDLLKHISPVWRLLAAAVSACLAAYFLGTLIERGSAPFLGGGAIPWLISVPLTIFAVTGLVHSVNIIDGMNGLASMTAVIMFGSMAVVAGSVNDALVLHICLVMIGAILGFFVWNYPAGWLFLGDGGAYFIGFMLAETSLLLVLRNTSVSPWYPFLLFIYPTFETAFTVYRRKVLRGRAVDVPDALHLHSLLFRRVMRQLVGQGGMDNAIISKRNALTSPLLWLLCLMAVFPATMFWDDNNILIAFSVCFCVSYVVLYRKILRK
jgi:UDP-N-acetylmuramyl pentapeptide phosphotransferase/UDP-N-acetylglucosamine-1-phosphate transferase